MVPEQKICELEVGALATIPGCVTVRGDSITFWYRKVDEAVKHRLKMGINSKGAQYFQQQGFNCAVVVFGGDHGADRFCCVLHLILQNTENNTI